MHQNKVVSKTILTNMSKSEKKPFFSHIFANNIFCAFFQNFFNEFKISVKFCVFLIPILNFFMNVSQNLIRQPSKALHNQVVKIVVPQCTMTLKKNTNNILMEICKTVKSTESVREVFDVLTRIATGEFIWGSR